jgi:hypothetical protein
VISSSVLPISRAPKLTPFLPPSTYRELKNCEKEEERKRK